MANKYIAQVENKNFVFPNNDLFEYDVDIIHDINNNSVTGSVSNFVVNITGPTMTIDFDYHWALNGAERQLLSGGDISIMSLHIMFPDKQYFKPWLCIDNISDENNEITSKTGHQQTIYTQAGGFPQGTYVFE